MKNWVLLIFIMAITVGCIQQSSSSQETPSGQGTENYEIPIVVEPSPFQVASEAREGIPISVSWFIEGSGPGVVSILYGNASQPGDFNSMQKTISDSGYFNGTPLKNIDLPVNFSADIVQPKDSPILYMRAYVIAGGKYYWSDERSVVIRSAQPQVPEPNIREFILEGDDSGFYPSSEITVTKGDIIKITFVTRTSGVYYGGLDYRSSYFNTGKILPGKNATVNFTAEKTFTFTSYWPSSGVKKADGTVIVTT